MIEVGDIWNLKGILGHVDVQMTQRYAHLSSQRQVVLPMSWIAGGGEAGEKNPTHYPHTNSELTLKNVRNIR